MSVIRSDFITFISSFDDSENDDLVFLYASLKVVQCVLTLKKSGCLRTRAFKRTALFEQIAGSTGFSSLVV